LMPRDWLPTFATSPFRSDRRVPAALEGRAMSSGRSACRRGRRVARSGWDLAVTRHRRSWLPLVTELPRQAMPNRSSTS